MGALAQSIRQGKALYVGISSYSPELTREAARDPAEGEGVPLLIHQPSYSMLNRWIEDELLDTLDELGVGCIAFSPLAQGMLSDKYLGGVPEDSRAAQRRLARPALLTPENIERIRALNAIAQSRGQTLAQMAIAWVLRDTRVTSALIGARTVAQLEDSVGGGEAARLPEERAGRDRPPRHRWRRGFVARVVEARQRRRRLSDARALIAALRLTPHPEGGWYRETWRADAPDGQRAAATAIRSCSKRARARTGTRSMRPSSGCSTPAARSAC